MFQEPIQRVGVVGMGEMGFPIARTILESGYDVTAYDLRDDPLARFEDVGGATAASPKDLAVQSQSVHIIVVNRSQAEDVIFGDDGILSGFDETGSGGIIVIHSSLAPKDAEDFATGTPDDVFVMDAPVSGGEHRAKKGDLTVMVGGDDDVVEYYAPVLESIAREVHHLGPVGFGIKAKLTNNAILYAEKVVTLETLEVAADLGFDKRDLVKLYQQSSANNYFIEHFDYQVYDQPQNFRGGPEQKLANSTEVMNNYLELTTEANADTPVFDVVRERFDPLMRAIFEEAREYRE